MRDFYRAPDTAIIVNKIERRRIWDDFVENRDIREISHLENQVPALYSEMENYITLRDYIWMAMIHKMWVSAKSLLMPEIS